MNVILEIAIRTFYLGNVNAFRITMGKLDYMVLE